MYSPLSYLLLKVGLVPLIPTRAISLQLVR